MSRNLPDLIERYCSEMDPAAHELLEERHQALNPENLDKWWGSIERMYSLPDVQNLVWARTNT